MTFLNWFGQALEHVNVADIKAPTHKVGEGETVIGCVDDVVTKKIWALRAADTKALEDLGRKELQFAVELFIAEQKADHNPLICRGCLLRREIAQLSDRRACLDQLFWSNVRQSLTEGAQINLDEAGGSLAIREDWKIIGSHPPQETIEIVRLRM